MKVGIRKASSLLTAHCLQLLIHNRVPQCHEGDAKDDASCHVACKPHDVAPLQHEHAFVGKGREGGEATA